MRGGHGIILLTFGGRATRVCGLTGKKKKKGAFLYVALMMITKALLAVLGCVELKPRSFASSLIWGEIIFLMPRGT